MHHRPALLLTGGSSRRMGTDKARIVWRGETLAERAARVLGAVCDPVLEVGAGATSLASVREYPPGRGPLAAVLHGIDELGDDTASGVFVLACDMPFVDAPLIALLATWEGSATVIPVRDGQPQYLCARYGPAWLRAASDCAATAFKAVPERDCTFVPEATWQRVAPAAALDDIDTPADRARSIGP